MDGKKFVAVSLAFILSDPSSSSGDITGNENMTVLAGNGSAGYSGENGPATSASLNAPGGIAIDSSGNVYISDTLNHRVRKVTPSGTITTVAGFGVQGFSGDGGQAVSARLNSPKGIAVDGSGNLYIVDSGNYCVRKVNVLGIITTAANIYYDPALEGITVDSSGSVYVSGTSGYVYKINTQGTYTIYMGAGYYSGVIYPQDNRKPADIGLYHPSGLCVDSQGELFIADSYQNIVYKVDSSGKVYTVAGRSSYFSTFSGDGGAAVNADLNGPASVAINNSGNLFIVDSSNHRVRKVNPSGLITTVAGNGFTDFTGDGKPAVQTSFSPTAVALDSPGRLYIADSQNNRVFRVPGLTPSGKPSKPSGEGPYLSRLSMTFSWTAGNVTDDAGISSYYLQVGDLPGGSNLFDGDVGNNLSKTVSGAMDGKTYYARVKAKDALGYFTDWSDASDGVTVVVTPPAPPILTSSSHPDAGTVYFDNSVIVSLSGPSDASGIAGYYYLLDHSSYSLPGTKDTFTSLNSVTLSDLEDGAWYFHAIAKDNAGNLGKDAAHFSFHIKSSVDPASNNVFKMTDGTRIEIPAGTVNLSTKLLIQRPSTYPPAPDHHMTPSKVQRDIHLANGISNLGRDVKITLTYAPEDVPGLTESTLKLFTYDASQGQWVQTKNSSVDLVRREVSGYVSHFSLFSIMSVPITSAQTPFKILGGILAPDRPGGAAGARIVFTLVQPGAVTIRIYDASGQAVRSLLSYPQSSGEFQMVWDGKDNDGDLVASGVYLVKIEAPGISAVRKMVVAR